MKAETARRIKRLYVPRSRYGELVEGFAISP